MATTSGLVQRLKWVPGASAVFVYVGPIPGQVQLFLLVFDDPDSYALASKRAMARLLTSAQLGGLPVTLTYEAGQASITGVDVRYALIRVDGVEITQSVQTLGNSVPLLAIKKAVARVYVSSRLAAPVTVSGTLRVSRSGTPDLLVPSSNQIVVDPAQFGEIEASRESVAGSLNFVLPHGHTAAGVTDLALIGLTDVGGSAPLNFTPNRTLEAAVFVSSPPLRLGLVGFSYDFGSPPQAFIPSATDFAFISSWLQRAYPVSQVVASQQVVVANATPPFTCGQINSQLAAIRALDVSVGVDPRTHYYGVVSDGGFFMRGCAAVPGTANPAAVGSGPTGPASWGWDFDGSYGDWYAGHEIGHTFGRKHPGFCGESNSDANYPFDNGQLSDADREYAGFDVGDPVQGLDMAALPGTDWHDVMTYCTRQWLSSYTYEGILQRLIAEDALGPGGGGAGRPDERFPEGFEPEEVTRAAQRRNLISLVARVNVANSTGEIEYVNPIEKGELTPEDAASPVLLRMKGPDGQSLRNLRVPIVPFSDEGQGEELQALCNIVFAAHSNTSVLELYVNERLADTFRVAELPGLGAVRVERGPRATMINWGDGTTLRAGQSYNIQLSDDGGRSWRTVAVGLRSPTVNLPEGFLPEDRRVLLRVQASAGLRATETVVEVEPPRRQSAETTRPRRRPRQSK